MTIPAWVEIQLAVGGALRLACGDRSGLGFFDTSIEGFWRSFRAAVLCYPAYLVLLPTILITGSQWVEFGAVSIVVVETIRYVITWVALPLIILPIADLFGRGSRFLTFMVVYNWSQIPIFLLCLVIGLDGATGLVPLSILAPAQIGVFIAVLVYEWYIARVALGVTGAQATLIVIVAQVLDTGLDRIAQSIY